MKNVKQPNNTIDNRRNRETDVTIDRATDSNIKVLRAIRFIKVINLTGILVIRLKWYA